MPQYPTAKAVAGTYSVRGHDHPYDLVQEYEHVIRAAARNPNKGSSALSSVVELPRSRIRTWVDEDGMPDAARGIETAQKHGWIAVDLDSRQFDALNTLIAGVFSGGTINDMFVPAFAPDEDGITITRIRDALDQLGAGATTRAGDDPGRTTEILPSRDASVLGRVLIALGAPHGAKSAASDISLPAYLDDAPDDVRRDFVTIYLWNRGQRPSESDLVQIIEERPQSFRDELGSMIEDVADGPVYVTNHAVRVSAEAARNLQFSREEVL